MKEIYCHNYVYLYPNKRGMDVIMKGFKTNNVIVRKFEMKDVEQAHFNLLEDNKGNNFNNICASIDDMKCENIAQTRMIVKSAINEYYTDEPVWAVEDKQNKNLVGYIRVINYSAKNKMCNITWAMSCKYLGCDFMKEALTQIFNFLFVKKGIELIECSYYEKNKNTGVMLDEIGMTKEAVLRDRRINEQTLEKENFVIYSINKQEFFNYLEQLLLEA